MKPEYISYLLNWDKATAVSNTVPQHHGQHHPDHILANTAEAAAQQARSFGYQGISAWDFRAMKPDESLELTSVAGLWAKRDCCLDWRPVCQDLVATLRTEGFLPYRADNGEERRSMEKDTDAGLVAFLTATDESTLLVRCSDGKIRALFLVFGNSPEELVCDHTYTEALEKAVSSFADKWVDVDVPIATRTEVHQWTISNYPASEPQESSPCKPLPTAQSKTSALGARR
jgi:hypothetical protein